MDKKDLLKATEVIKKEIEDGKLTNLLIIGGNTDDSITTQVVSTGIEAIGLADLLKDKVHEQIVSQSNKQDFIKMLNALVGK